LDYLSAGLFIRTSITLFSEVVVQKEQKLLQRDVNDLQKLLSPFLFFDQLSVWLVLWPESLLGDDHNITRLLELSVRIGRVAVEGRSCVAAVSYLEMGGLCASPT
jgi:hypothetical protein